LTIEGRETQVDATRRTAFIAGLLFIITFITSIPAALILYSDVLDNVSTYIGGSGKDMAVPLGALLEMLLIIANIGTALWLFPILKRQHEALALGYVAARIIESTFIAIGLVCLLAVVTLRQDVAGAAGSLTAAGESLVAIHDWTFLLGPGWVVGVGNGLTLGYLMYRSGLVPRGMAILGMVGGTVLLIGGTAALFDVIDKDSALKALSALLEAAWELSLGIYLMVKGFKPAPILSRNAGTVGAGTS
jgi:hypothetical protein